MSSLVQRSVSSASLPLKSTLESERLQHARRVVVLRGLALPLEDHEAGAPAAHAPRRHPRGREPEVDPAASAGGSGPVAGGLQDLNENGFSEPWSGSSVTFWSSCQLMQV